MVSRRERYERANMRGGLGVRKRLSEDSFKTSYRLNGIQTGSVVVRAHDKYRGDFTKGFDVGVLVRRTASVATIHWYGDEEATNYSQGDARYEVDRGRWKFLGLMQGNPLDPNNPLADALTALRQNARIQAGDQPPTPPTEEKIDMAKEMSNAAAEREAAQRALKNGEFKERETYTAKQIAGRCGTDAKTMRKFFRSSHSTVEPVGQGGRYEFDAKDFPKIKREFDAWQNKSKARSTPKKDHDEVVSYPGQMMGSKSDPVVEAEVEKFNKVIAEHPELDDNEPEERGAYLRPDEEPSPEELEELEDFDLDLDDLDAEDD